MPCTLTRRKAAAGAVATWEPACSLLADGIGGVLGAPAIGRQSEPCIRLLHAEKLMCHDRVDLPASGLGMYWMCWKRQGEFAAAAAALCGGPNVDVRRPSLGRAASRVRRGRDSAGRRWW